MTDLIYAVGDIHGALEQLKEVHDRIARDAAGRPHTVVHVGDLVDRREDSRGTIDYLMQGQASGAPWVVLKGNHDRMMTLFIRHGQRDPILRGEYTWLWSQLGAAQTLASYGLDITGMAPDAIRAAAQQAVPEAHLAYLEGLPDRYDTPEIFFCHAGIAPGVALKDQVEDDLIWIRTPFHDHPGPHPKLIVHGHTPVEAVTHYGHRINIDTGCAYGRELSVVVFEGTTASLLTAGGRTPLSVDA